MSPRMAGVRHMAETATLSPVQGFFQRISGMGAGVGVRVGNSVGVGVRVGNSVGVGVRVGNGVGVGVRVGKGVGVRVRVGKGEAVGEGGKVGVAVKAETTEDFVASEVAPGACRS